MTTFQDIFKSSFLERLDSVSLLDTAIALALAFLLGLFIFLVYRRSYSGVMYSPRLILAVTSNIVLSLGMVGALSIVRFRTAIKEPMDIAFLFWAIAAGIVLAAGLIPLAVLGSLFVGIVLLVFSRQKNGESPYILVVHWLCGRAGGHGRGEPCGAGLLQRGLHGVGHDPPPKHRAHLRAGHGAGPGADGAALFRGAPGDAGRQRRAGICRPPL